MPDNDKKPIVHVVPAILTGIAALLAALTTVYVNVRGDKSPGASPATTATQTSPRSAMPASARMRLRVDRIVVQHDGSIGTTDWRFAVAADGQPLFVFAQDALDDAGGRNVAVPADAVGNIELAAGKPVKISIDGWRGSRLRFTRGAPDVHGEGRVSASGMLAPIVVRADKPDAGAFVFHFSAAPADGSR